MKNINNLISFKKFLLVETEVLIIVSPNGIKTFVQSLDDTEYETEGNDFCRPKKRSVIQDACEILCKKWIEKEKIRIDKLCNRFIDDNEMQEINLKIFEIIKQQIKAPAKFAHFTRLQNNKWGCVVYYRPKQYEDIEVYKKDGTIKKCRIESIISSNNGICVCSIVEKPRYTKQRPYTYHVYDDENGNVFDDELDWQVSNDYY